MNFKFQNQSKVTFEEKGHTYTNGKGQKYKSVTTVLGDYSHKFDTAYWSTYKAVKDVMVGINLFHRYKQAAGGWDKVPDYYIRNKNKLDETIKNNIETKRAWYVAEWKKESEYAAKLGNMHHKDLEGLMLSHKKIDLGQKRYANVSAADLLDFQGFTDFDNSAHTELLLWNDRFRLAGQADLVERTGMQVHIKDYKTCKKIELEPFMDRHMFEPLQFLPDMNYSKFTMQLSTYGWMLEQIGYEVVGLTMVHIDRITGNHIKDYPLAYRPDLVIKMLEHHDSKGIRESAKEHA